MTQFVNEKKAKVGQREKQITQYFLFSRPLSYSPPPTLAAALPAPKMCASDGRDPQTRQPRATLNTCHTRPVPLVNPRPPRRPR